ncbi:28521_t:CDS:2 [Dentiscutata erythropus]|uniref:28521_t:CDS:1 n=1 Tax=Dentiscutata erythropus TaxID=1348616 RepID=A0A9N9B2M4_9GLOM|nr:28521_t:CDS:2 [Dentiscutata erythropus]
MNAFNYLPTAYENITSNLPSLFGSIRSIYHSLKCIFDDDQAVGKANGEDLFKQLEYISQLHSGLKCNQDVIENKGDDFMDIDISDSDEDEFINLSLETIISQYYHTESLIDGLSRDLERTER